MCKLPHKYYNWSNNKKVERLIARDARIAELEQRLAEAEQGKCDCTESDSWRCAVYKNLDTVSCPCECHKQGGSDDG